MSAVGGCCGTAVTCCGRGVAAVIGGITETSSVEDTEGLVLSGVLLFGSKHVQLSSDDITLLPSLPIFNAAIDDLLDSFLSTEVVDNFLFFVSSVPGNELC